MCRFVGRRYSDAGSTFLRPASEKRQCRKSRGGAAVRLAAHETGIEHHVDHIVPLRGEERYAAFTYRGIYRYCRRRRT